MPALSLQSYIFSLTPFNSNGSITNTPSFYRTCYHADHSFTIDPLRMRKNSAGLYKRMFPIL
ncbi:hypothetical protein LL3_01481 [Bacillus sp. CN2]|nr:hypothetical protein LL3_01481 [Bacillus sp. CN2]